MTSTLPRGASRRHVGGPHPQHGKFVAWLAAENVGENVGRLFDGAPLKDIVNRTAGY